MLEVGFLKQAPEYIIYLVYLSSEKLIMSHTYWLPDPSGEEKEIVFKTETNSVIIVGANGAGKSRLGAWIEKNHLDQVHRIAPQRSLNYPDVITIKDFKTSSNNIVYGCNDERFFEKKDQKWDWGKSYTTKLVSDFESVLSALISKYNNQCAENFEKGKKGEFVDFKNINTVHDQLKSIWNSIFPHRKIEIRDGNIYASFSHGNKKEEYLGNQMSDGERSVLYLTAQILCIPNNMVLVIDEPELHLHRSIMNKLWFSIEKERKDCLFIYITHDTDFAAQHGISDKFWIQEYANSQWNYVKIPTCDLPEDLLLDLLGTRKNVLFIEGDNNSLDLKMYSEIYPEYRVIPCGSCKIVIERTKSFKSCSAIHHIKAKGLIDRDYRTEAEIIGLAKNDVYTLQVAEIENLFLTEGVLKLIFNDLKKEEVAKDFVKSTFESEIYNQILESTKSIIRYKLRKMPLKVNSLSEIQSEISGYSENILNEVASIQKQFENTKGKYNEILKFFNHKGLISGVEKKLNMRQGTIRKIALERLRGDSHDATVKAFLAYLPMGLSDGQLKS